MESQTTHIPESIARLLDAEGKINQSVTCIGCEYDLRTMHHDASCPECGRRVWDSLRLVRLSDFDPAWILAIAKGFRLIAISIALPFIVGLAGYVIYETTGAEQVAGMSVVTAVVTSFVLLFYGAWLLGRYSSDEPRGVTRKFARAGSRWLLMIFVIGSFASLAIRPLLYLISPALSDSVSPSLFPIIVLASAGGGAVAILLRASFLARLVPSAAIARQGLVLGGCLAVISVVLLLAAILESARYENWVDLLPDAAADAVLYCAELSVEHFHPHGWIVWYVTLPALLLWMAVLLWWCSRRFYEARRAALRRIGNAAVNTPSA